MFGNDTQRPPYLIRRRDGAHLGFAGLWEAWTDRETGEEITTCIVITCEPNAPMAELHARMPVILDPADYDVWLDPGRGGTELLRPCPGEWLEAIPVSARVNSPRNNDATILQPESQVLAAQACCSERAADDGSLPASKLGACNLATRVPVHSPDLQESDQGLQLSDQELAT